jgi:hypothetical protein
LGAGRYRRELVRNVVKWLQGDMLVDMQEKRRVRLVEPRRGERRIVEMTLWDPRTKKIERKILGEVVVPPHGIRFILDKSVQSRRRPKTKRKKRS